MNIPSFLSSHMLNLTHNNKTNKIKSFGLSNEGLEAAKSHAIERYQQAQQTLLTIDEVVALHDKLSRSRSNLPLA